MGAELGLGEFAVEIEERTLWRVLKSANDDNDITYIGWLCCIAAALSTSSAVRVGNDCRFMLPPAKIISRFRTVSAGYHIKRNGRLVFWDDWLSHGP